jgi:hypothetical protein
MGICGPSLLPGSCRAVPHGADGSKGALAGIGAVRRAGGGDVRQGADRAALKDRKDDLYETPACAVHALLRVEWPPREIWEPCAGRGAIVRILRERGHDVVAHDLVTHPGADPGIETPIDFLMERRAPAGHRCIVSNLPFKNADPMIRHGLELGCDMIVLQRLMALEGAGRSDLIDRHLVRVWAGKERLPQMHREGWAGNKQSNSGAPFAWFVFKPDRNGKAVEFNRMSWRDTDYPIASAAE